MVTFTYDELLIETGDKLLKEDAGTLILNPPNFVGTTSETISLSGIKSVTKILFLVISETISLAETILYAVGRVFTETISLSGTQSLKWSAFITETISLSCSLSFASVQSITVSETLSLTALFKEVSASWTWENKDTGSASWTWENRNT